MRFQNVRVKMIMEVDGMKIGIPREIKNNENRVGLSPSGVHALVESGHTVLVENKCGFRIVL
ncbi:hypothetical protein [Staphylococcus aureus]|uniref:hypothetical protein n=1 Tax=Staphylococcus aureus TaxID=1280 RepID=UPI0022B25536|nr:hypothetical protein [Staphylococcus aureus]